jgi:hypothetical protein
MLPLFLKTDFHTKGIIYDAKHTSLISATLVLDILYGVHLRKQA